MPEAVIPYLVLVFSVVLHELGHGYAALALGDTTAQRMGRLTVNPIPHVDPFYTLIMPMVLTFMGLPPLGGARPVPVDPRQFRGASPRRGMLLVAAAGPMVNFALLLVSALLLHLGISAMPRLLIVFLFWTFVINAILGLFNLIPIPPLDGSKILAGVLPREQALSFMRIDRLGLVILIVMMMTGIHDIALNWVLSSLSHILPAELGPAFGRPQPSTTF
jgi:Zn-dependent protease